MAFTDIGGTAIDRAAYTGGDAYTYIDRTNPADGDGTITQIEVWLNTAATSGFKVGTFYGSGTSWTLRAYANLGNLPAGYSKITGLSIAVQAGDILGWYNTPGSIDCDTSGGGGVGYVAGDKFGGGTNTYTILANYVVSLYGTPAGAQTIYPSSIVQVVAIGAPVLFYPQTLLPSSIVQAIVYGTPSVFIAGQAGFIYPQSIVQQISIGSPTLLKYVWHVILDGQYATETPGVNRAYVIGTDANGNPVYGTAVDSAELGLVGERLDFQPDPAIPTTAQAGDVASAVLSKMRLRGKGGVILIPPNCGQELFDVVQITDSGANQSAVVFRVIGIRFEYNPKQARYQHRLILGAP